MITYEDLARARVLKDADHDIQAVGQITSALDQAVWDLQSAVSLYDKNEDRGDTAGSLLEDVQAAQSALDAAVVNALSALAKV